MDTFKTIEVLTQAATLAMFATGIPPIWHMCKTGNTRGVPYYFFLIGAVNSLMGLCYGFLITNSVIIFLNSVGSVLNVIYSLSYLYVTTEKKFAFIQLSLAVGWMGIVAGYMTSQSGSHVTNQLGMILCGMTSVLLTSPLLEIVHAVRQGSAADISVVMLCGTLVCSSLWLFYGMLLGDFFIYAPNFPGVATCLGKIGVLTMYGGASKKRKIVKKKR